jgi:NAD(P)-dependent dehydrogenase (short-subunit alcohol dehydrogenase family)
MEAEALTARTALVTGASSDLGRAIALALAADGATVLAVGRRRERLDEIATHPAIRPLVLDLTDESAVLEAAAGWGPVDILVANAAHGPELAPLLNGGMDTLRAVMETNFFAVARLVTLLLPGMVERKWGRVIHVSSLAASIGEAHGPSYCASKAAVDGLWRNLAIDYSPHGVTFNSLELGPVRTERLERHGAMKTRRLGLAAAVRRVGEPSDAAHAVRFLASPLASYVTGESLRVDGGLHLGNPLAAMYVREPSTAAETPS